MAVTKDLADNPALAVIARFAMIAATAALPAVGWLLVRSVNTVDEIGHKVDVVHDRTLETNAAIKLIQQTEATQSAVLADHESRMRILERMSNGKAPQ